MKTFAVALAFLLLIAGAAAELQAQMGTGRVTGTVKDEEGNPVAGAKVQAEMSGEGTTLEAVTDKKGHWGIIGFRSGAWNFTVTAEGYQPATLSGVRVQQLQRNPPLEFTLAKLQQGKAAGGEKAAALLGEANQLFDQKNYQEALAKYLQLLAENPTLHQIHLNMGNVHRATGELDEALAEYQMVLDVEPDHVGALVQTGDVLVKKGELENAVGYFEKALAQSPGDEALPFNVAEIYFNTGNVEKAIEHYQKAHQAKPDWPEPLLKLGYAYLNLGDIAKATEHFEKVVAVAPETPQAEMAKAALASLKKD